MVENQVEIGTLDVGTVFVAPWRPEGKQYGELLDKGVGSVGVRIPDIYEDGKFEGQGMCRWSHGTFVTPVTREEYNLNRSASGSNRERSATDNPVEKVWAICNANPSLKVGEIVEKCIAEGINKNTAKTQFYAWRKSRGQ